MTPPTVSEVERLRQRMWRMTLLGRDAEILDAVFTWWLATNRDRTLADVYADRELLRAQNGILQAESKKLIALWRAVNELMGDKTKTWPPLAWTKVQATLDALGEPPK